MSYSPFVIECAQEFERARLAFYRCIVDERAQRDLQNAAKELAYAIVPEILASVAVAAPIRQERAA